MQAWLKRSGAPGQRRPATRGERGQALVVVAMAMIGLIAFVGLTVDSGILFISEGHLRRAVDAAALAAAAQFRVGRTHDQLAQSAAETLRLNGINVTGINDPTFHMYLCDPTDPKYDDTLNDPGSTMCAGTTKNKLIKVVAQVPVRFAFLSIIGIPSTTIVANSVSETASVDVVLVIDTSNSMTFGISDEIKGSYNCTPGPTCNPMWDPAICNAAPAPDPGYVGDCLPFHYVKKAAVDFINHLYFPYDRLAIVTFDNVPTVQVPLTNTLTVAQITDWVKGNGVAGIGDGTTGLQVSPPRDPGYPGSPCTYQPYSGQPSYQPDPSACTNTSTGGGLRDAGGEFGRPPIRQEAVWVVILLTDGAANASVPSADGSKINSVCPVSTWWDPTTLPHLYSPFCRDYDPTTRHTSINPQVYNNVSYDLGHTTPYNPQSTYDATNYDADDYARDQADFVACAAKYAQAAKWCRDSLNYTINQGGQGAVIFSIGLGGLVIDNSQGGYSGTGGSEVRIDPSSSHAGYAAGDSLLRYVANVGADGNPDPSVGPDACQGLPAPSLVAQPDPAAPTLPAGNLSYNCGNYYFAQFGTGLTSVFQSIASRIFTRITQ